MNNIPTGYTRRRGVSTSGFVIGEKKPHLLKCDTCGRPDYSLNIWEKGWPINPDLKVCATCELEAESEQGQTG